MRLRNRVVLNSLLGVLLTAALTLAASVFVGSERSKSGRSSVEPAFTPEELQISQDDPTDAKQPFLMARKKGAKKAAKKGAKKAVRKKAAKKKRRRKAARPCRQECFVESNRLFNICLELGGPEEACEAKAQAFLDSCLMDCEEGS